MTLGAWKYLHQLNLRERVRELFAMIGAAHSTVTPYYDFAQDESRNQAVTEMLKSWKAR